MKSFKHLTIGVLAILVGFAIVGESRAIVISTYDHSGNGFASGNGADTYINENSPSGVYGGSVETYVRNQTGVRQESVYYRFDLSAIDKENASDAKLQIYDQRFGGGGTLPGNTFQIWALDNQSLDAWEETGASGVSWNSAPGHADDGTPFNGPDFNADAKLLGSFTYVQQGTSPWSEPIEISGLLGRVKYDTNDLLTLMVVGPAGNSTAFRTGTKESTDVSIWISTDIPEGSAAAKLVVEQPTLVVSTYDHDGDGLASGSGADTWIVESGPASNYGTGVDMKTRNLPDGPLLEGQQEVIYVRFDVSAVDKSLLDDAQLQLYDRRFNEGRMMDGDQFSVWALNNESLDNWSETAITWNNAPGHADDSVALDDPDFNADASYLGSFVFSQESLDNGWGLPADVAGLRDVIAADTDGQITLMISGPVGVGSLFYVGTKESWHDRFRYDPVEVPLGTVAPRLLVTHLTVPEPTTATMFLLIGLGLLPFRTRRRNRSSRE